MASDILIVDDEEDIRELVAGILGDEGHETRTAHDADSALAAIAEMAMAGGIGARLAPDTALPLHVWAFAEDQARYAVTLPESAAAAFLERAAKAGIPAARIGTTGGAELTLEGVKPISLKALKEAHEGWLPAYMAAGAEL